MKHFLSLAIDLTRHLTEYMAQQRIYKSNMAPETVIRAIQQFLNLACCKYYL